MPDESCRWPWKVPACYHERPSLSRTLSPKLFECPRDDLVQRYTLWGLGFREPQTLNIEQKRDISLHRAGLDNWSGHVFPDACDAVQALGFEV